MATTNRHAADSREQLLAALPVEERHRPIAGVSTAILEGGEGPSVVLLHGPGESSLWWMRVVPELVTTHRVIVPDLPGHGESEIVDNALDADSVLSWLDELVAETCPTPPTVVGHLLGGAIAARFASVQPARLDRLVLVDALGLGRFRPSPRFAFGLLRFLVRPSDRAYLKFLDQCMVDRDGLIEGMGDAWDPFFAYNLERSRTPSVKAAMRTLMKEVGIPRIPPETFAGITVPTSLIWGRNDRAMRVGIAEDASDRYGWPLHVIDDAADDPKLERPTAFLAALYEAIGSNRPVERLTESR